MKKLLILGLVALGLSASDLKQACIGCHGINWDKKALGKSLDVSKMSEKEIYNSLAGYKDGTYGGAMKGVMKGQVSRLTDSDLQLIAKQIAEKSTK